MVSTVNTYNNNRCWHIVVSDNGCALLITENRVSIQIVSWKPFGDTPHNTGLQESSLQRAKHCTAKFCTRLRKWKEHLIKLDAKYLIYVSYGHNNNNPPLRNLWEATTMSCIPSSFALVHCCVPFSTKNSCATYPKSIVWLMK
jgi:hypothetical protein